MAQYADYNFYQNVFYGEIIPRCKAHKWLSLASDEIDTLTFGRLTNAFPSVETHVEKVKKAVCAIAEALYQIDIQHKAVAAQHNADGSYRGAVASISSGRESISYAVGNISASTYAAAAASAVEQDKLLSRIAEKYLANIPDINGVNLLYAGV